MVHKYLSQAACQHQRFNNPNVTCLEFIELCEGFLRSYFLCRAFNTYTSLDERKCKNQFFGTAVSDEAYDSLNKQINI